jgi:hypothetical protein
VGQSDSRRSDSRQRTAAPRRCALRDWTGPGAKPAGLNSNNHAQDNERGFHVTKTIDSVYVLDDGLVLDLDRGSADLIAGDLVVLQAANHA